MNTQQPPREYEGDAGAPLPDFSGARNIQLSTVAPALGVPKKQAPDYLDYDQKGRGIIVTLFANSGMSYLLGITGGGLLGLREGLANAPSSRLRVQLNSILNHCGRHGSRWGNTIGVVSILYSLYEGAADHVRLQVSFVFALCPCTPHQKHFVFFSLTARLFCIF
mmetsp:Transcript_26323/g.61218  ORF Transcript_26323/g.61218 Transcript_26323/m.61218 type:complete len:165 (-) Transcript_26323:1229-1723(-)